MNRTSVPNPAQMGRDIVLYDMVIISMEKEFAGEMVIFSSDEIEMLISRLSNAN